MNAGTYNFPSIFTTETFIARQIRIKYADDTNLPSPLAFAQFQVREIDATDLNADLTLTTDNGGITIINAAEWRIQINRILSLELDPQQYVYALLCVDEAGNRQTYLQGDFPIDLSPSR